MIYLGEQKSYFWIAPADKVAIRRISVFDGGDRVEVALLGKGEGTLDRTIALDSLVEFSNLVQVGLLRTAGVTEGDDSDDFFIVSPYVITPLGLELLRRFESLCDAVRNVKAPEGV